ncbi:MAG: hypothetical protein COB93_05105 [Sneathiella sp.]|nr:MAG: hypothetical protein COB93_05105 [Sneathiella sp.]
MTDQDKRFGYDPAQDQWAIDSLEGLTALYGPAHPIALAKETPYLTEDYRRWIEASPFFALATIGAGGLDCSPRGDRTEQLFHILDERTLVIPDRRGNNRLDSLKNIVSDPRVALLFLLPGIDETLRINGRAHLTTNPELIERFDINGKKPATVIIVEIESVYFQCARALTRAKIWDPSTQITRTEAPTAGQMIKSAKADFDGESYDLALAERQKESLY